MDGQLKATYYVAIGADPSLIRWRYVGAERVTVDRETGDLLVTLPAASDGMEPSELREQAPVAWQEIGGKQVAVPVRYQVAADSSVSFALPGGYNRAHPLTLDPTLVYARRLGGSESDVGLSVAVDTEGNVYLTGETFSSTYPTTPGVVQAQSGGDSDAFVSKLSADGSTLLYSTFLGGLRGERGEGIAVDAIGNVYVVGKTFSADFPTANAYQPTYGDHSDGFVTKLDPTGSALLYSTYLGGDFIDGVAAIALDAAGSAHVTGNTFSSNFPTENALQPLGGGFSDAFVTTFHPDGSSLLYSSYLGGGATDSATGIAVDSAGHIHVAGWTESMDFPLADPFQSEFGGPYADAFVTKVDPSTPAYLYSTFLGGATVDWASDIATDSEGNSYVTGSTNSPDFPVVLPLQGLAGDYDFFVTTFNSNGSTPLFSTYYGGSGRDESEGIALAPSGQLYVVGASDSSDFPLVDPIQAAYGGNSDAALVKIVAGGTVEYATYLGGSNREYGWDVAAGATAAYISGETYSDEFPGIGVSQTSSESSDLFVARIDTGQGPPSPTATVTEIGTATPSPVLTETPEPTLTPTSAADSTPTATSTPDVTPTATPTDVPLFARWQPAQMQMMQATGQVRRHAVRLHNLLETPLVWSSYEGHRSCVQPRNQPWLHLAPDAGVTLPGQASHLMIYVDTRRLPAGTHIAHLCVLNSTGNLQGLPVRLRVVASPP